jgi:hypothetical protein
LKDERREPHPFFVVERYYRAHKQELDEQDRCIRARTEERLREQRLRFPEPEGSLEERRAKLKERFDRRRQENPRSIA